MPYKIVMDGEKHCVVKSADGKKMGCHSTHAEAVGQMRAIMARESMSQVLWVDPFEYIEGKAFRIFPIKKAKRGEREIDVTRERLTQMKENYDSDRPRWRIPIYAGHPTDTQPDPPKLGNASQLELRDDGLYVIPEFTGEGKSLVEDGKYQYCSPGVLWSVNGSLYTDEQGNEFDNVIDHIALTNKPFWGKETMVFSSDPNLIRAGDEAEEIVGRLSKLEDQFREFDTEMREKMAKSGMAMDDGSYPIENEGDLKNAIQAFGRAKNPAAVKAHIKKRAKALGKTDLLPENWTDSTRSDIMSDTVVTPEAFAELQGKFAEMNKALAEKDEKAEAFAVELKAAKEQADKFAEENKALADKFAEEQKAHRLDALRIHADTFTHFPANRDEFAEKFYALEVANPELAKWVDEKFTSYETMAATGNLFEQVTNSTAKKGVETFEDVIEKVLKDEFSGDRSKYGQAMDRATELQPDLAAKYLAR